MSAIQLKSAPFLATLLIPFIGMASAQENPLSVSTEELTSREAIGQAAAELIDAGKDKLLITNMLGTEIKGSDGDTIGTIEDFVVIPGGRLIAAIVEVDDYTRLAIPFGAVKISGAADDLGLEVPIAAEEIKGMDELEELSQTVTGN